VIVQVPPGATGPVVQSCATVYLLPPVPDRLRPVMCKRCRARALPVICLTDDVRPRATESKSSASGDSAIPGLTPVPEPVTVVVAPPIAIAGSSASAPISMPLPLLAVMVAS
jgi:hypothetical protein